MLTRFVHPSGVVAYISPLLQKAGVPHGFSTRIGGISPAPFDSLNLGNPNGCDIQDDYEHIWRNYQLLQAAVGCAADQRPCRVHQVHGAAVEIVRQETAVEPSIKADALVSDDPTRVMSIRIADCVPVLLATSDGRRVAAVHAGWRGVIADVVPAALHGMAGLSQPTTPEIHRTGAGMSFTGKDVVAAIGPCIGYEAFEVGPEVVAEFVRRFGARAPCRMLEDGKGRVDLRGAVRRQLIEAGVPNNQIDVTDRCTFTDATEFYSHRRDKGVTGRMAAVIQCRR